MEGKRTHAAFEEVVAVPRVGERGDLVSGVQQPLGDVTAGVPEGAGDRVDFRRHMNSGGKVAASSMLTAV